MGSMQTKPWKEPPSALQVWVEQLPALDTIVELKIQGQEKPRKHSAPAALTVCAYCLLMHIPFQAFAHDEEIITSDGENVTALDGFHAIMKELESVVGDIANIAAAITHERLVRDQHQANLEEPAAETPEAESTVKTEASTD